MVVVLIPFYLILKIRNFLVIRRGSNRKVLGNFDWNVKNPKLFFDRSSASDTGEENVGVGDKRLSAVTLARMEQKRQIQQLLIENNFDKPQTLRTLIVKSASEGRNRRSTGGNRPNDRKTSKWPKPIMRKLIHFLSKHQYTIPSFAIT